MEIKSFRFISCNLLPKLGDYTALEYGYIVESQNNSYLNQNLPTNFLILKISDPLNMIWELDYSDYRLSDVLFEYTKNYILYKIRKNNLLKKEVIEITELQRNILASYAKENLTGFLVDKIEVVMKSNS